MQCADLLLQYSSISINDPSAHDPSYCIDSGEHIDIDDYSRLNSPPSSVLWRSCEGGGGAKLPTFNPTTDDSTNLFSFRTREVTGSGCLLYSDDFLDGKQ